MRIEKVAVKRYVIAFSEVCLPALGNGYLILKHSAEKIIRNIFISRIKLKIPLTAEVG